MSTLTFRTKLGYGVGHVLNDLCSAMWFSYLLLYLNHVLLYPNTLAGLILLIGQFADGLSTPFVGHEADRTDDLQFCVKYGRKKTWHFVGTVCVLVSFSFIFMGCLACTSGSSAMAGVIYYTPFVVLFQFGWAATQVSHLAILPTLSDDPHDRTELNAIRYAFTVLSTITVYCITWLVLGLTTPSTTKTNVLGPQDKNKFVAIVLVVLAIGVIFSIIFHAVVSERRCETVQVNPDEAVERVVETQPSNKRRVAMQWKDWLKERQFYLVSLLYMATRLFCNLIQVYVPIYLQDTLILDEKSIAYIPLVMFVCGLLTTTVMKKINRYIGRKQTFLIGCAFGLSGCIWVLWGSGPFYLKYGLYGVAALLGSGTSTMLVTVLSISADMIGNHIECGAFVYGALSFWDKVANGIAVMAIQALTPCLSCCALCRSYFTSVVGYGCGGAAVLAALTTLALFPVKIGELNFDLPKHTEEQRRSSDSTDTESLNSDDVFLPNEYASLQQSDPSQANSSSPDSIIRSRPGRSEENLAINVQT